jgi:hypothetical protein
MSSIVLASVALFVNSTFQKTQIAAADRMAQAQIRNENAKATTDLIQHLLSNDPARQRIALVALRRAVLDDDEMVIDIVSVVASTAHDDGVFEEATATLSASKSPKVARALSQIAAMQAKAHGVGSAANAQVAYLASQHVALRASLAPGTAIFYAARPGETTDESDRLQSGVLTGLLLRALVKAPQEIMPDGLLRVDSLYTYLSQSINTFDGRRTIPMVEASGSKEIPLIPPATKKVFVLSIGVSKYSSAIPALKYAAKDAESISSYFRNHSGTARTLVDSSATKEAILDGLDSISREAEEESTFVMYYSGHGWNVDGEQYIAPADLAIGSSPAQRTSPFVEDTLTKSIGPLSNTLIPDRSISFSEIRSALFRIRSKHKIMLIDACANNPFMVTR